MRKLLFVLFLIAPFDAMAQVKPQSRPKIEWSRTANDGHWITCKNVTCRNGKVVRLSDCTECRASNGMPGTCRRITGRKALQLRNRWRLR
jgi:hypothetical protein